MKKMLLFLAVLSAILVVGCERDVTSVAEGEGLSSLTLSLPKTRTSLGEKVGDVYPLYWSEGDKISVNGVESSEAEINADDASRANFSFATEVNYPLNILYPSGSTVIFPAKQSYAEGSFAEGSVPMCAYVASKGEAITMKHLAAVLRLPVKSATEGITLQKIVVKSLDGAKLSGEFSVDCQKATIAPSSNSATSVTYTANIALSTTTVHDCYISLPSGDAGECVVEFIDSEGGVMEGSWSAKTLVAGVVREFKDISYKRGGKFALQSLGSESDELDTYPNQSVRGYVRDNSGRGIEGVAVSDGFTVAKTDEYGFYRLQVSSDAWYIYISVPAEYEIERGDYGLPNFYQSYNVGKSRYDFELKPLAGGKESTFALFALADIHITSQAKADAFKNRVIPHVNRQYEEYAQQGIPAYGVILGDNITNYSEANTSAWRDDILPGLALSKTPMFSVFGNHDIIFFNSDNRLSTDARSSTFNLKVQREFEEMFGPVNYSFNRGDVHIVCMRNMLYDESQDGSFTRGFTDEQYRWLEQDMALVPKDKMAILCVHYQMYDGKEPHCQDVLALFAQYKEAHIFSGHGHIHRNTRNANHNSIYEHVNCAVAGPVWTFDLCGDGTPCGYQIFKAEGAKLTDWYFISHVEGIDTRNHQMRLYRGNTTTGGEISGTNANGTKGYYKFNFGENVILANVYNADSKWKIAVYEDGEYSGNMVLASTLKPTYSTLIGDGSYDNPFRFADDVESGMDLYVLGFHLGLRGRKTSHSGAWQQCTHMYKYELKNKDSKVKVVVTDRWGKVYESEEFVDGTTYSFVDL